MANKQKEKRKIVMLGIEDLTEEELRKLTEEINKALYKTGLSEKYYFLIVPKHFEYMNKENLLRGFKKAVTLLEVCDNDEHRR